MSTLSVSNEERMQPAARLAALRAATESRKQANERLRTLTAKRLSIVGSDRLKADVETAKAALTLAIGACVADEGTEEQCVLARDALVAAEVALDTARQQVDGLDAIILAAKNAADVAARQENRAAAEIAVARNAELEPSILALAAQIATKLQLHRAYVRFCNLHMVDEKKQAYSPIVMGGESGMTSLFQLQAVKAIEATTRPGDTLNFVSSDFLVD